MDAMAFWFGRLGEGGAEMLRPYKKRCGCTDLRRRIPVMLTASAHEVCFAAFVWGYIVNEGGSRTAQRADRYHHLFGACLAPF
jgi:hypothetical protein